ncbi:sensor histidine kinase [Anaerotignum sp.]|uniref:sensor histidine kinase n=1 Tax=Anaerotignum sp. TaxID=2039241 RepID=UPI0028AD3937|nr:HAMP domain-containing sensor histidine kinase [Anaerotignum sp.]
MKIIANRKIKFLFFCILMCISAFILVSVVLMNIKISNAALSIFLCALFMALAIFTLCYKYFREQHKIIESAVAEITEYIAGNKDARIQSNEEGELYRLFHEVNSLVSILNAHAENELRAKEFLKDTIADISHQLKTPLAALNIYNGILQDEEKNPQAVREFTNLSEQELDRIEALVQNLLKITKMDAGTVVLEERVENVSEMIERVEKHFAFRAKQEKKEIRLTGDDTLTLVCDGVWLTEAINNIVKNALDHIKNGGLIQIQWKQLSSVIQIIIKDNGSGIHPEDLYYIFKRFYRSKFSKDTQGIGLGLPLAKSIIEAHNGTVRVDSELGVGTTFVIDFLIPTKM